MSKNWGMSSAETTIHIHIISVTSCMLLWTLDLILWRIFIQNLFWEVNLHRDSKQLVTGNCLFTRFCSSIFVKLLFYTHVTDIHFIWHLLAGAGKLIILWIYCLFSLMFSTHSFSAPKFKRLPLMIFKYLKFGPGPLGHLLRASSKYVIRDRLVSCVIGTNFNLLLITLRN